MLVWCHCHTSEITEIQAHTVVYSELADIAVYSQLRDAASFKSGIMEMFAAVFPVWQKE